MWPIFTVISGLGGGATGAGGGGGSCPHPRTAMAAAMAIREDALGLNGIEESPVAGLNDRRLCEWGRSVVKHEQHQQHQYDYL
jgi:hypothetical protein